jgi:uncharacterized protein (TIGR02246 family)
MPMLAKDDEQAIQALFDSADRALVCADVDALARVFADDYIQYDASGKPFTKQEILTSLRTTAVRYPSIVSTGRTVRVFGDFAVVHGSESDEVEKGGQRLTVKYLYMDVARKKDGVWQIVAGQLAVPQ